MSSPSAPDPAFQPAAITDEELLVAHEKLLEKQPDDRAHYKLMPLGLLFFFSGLILFAATYLNRYSGHFDPTIFNENALPSTGKGVEVAIDPVVFGKQLFNQSGACITCHQPTGLGIPGTYPPLAGSEWVNGPDERVIAIVLYGLQGAVHVTGKSFSAAVMPSFGASGFNWNDDKVADVLTYVRQEWGNKGAPVTADEVKAVREKNGSRAAWNEADLLQMK